MLLKAAFDQVLHCSLRLKKQYSGVEIHLFYIEILTGNTLRSHTYCINMHGLIYQNGKIIAFKTLKAAYSVTFDLLILKTMFLFFKNTVKILKFR